MRIKTNVETDARVKGALSAMRMQILRCRRRRRRVVRHAGGTLTELLMMEGRRVEDEKECSVFRRYIAVFFH